MDDSDAFRVPVFCNPAQDRTFIQQVDITGSVIVDFSEIEFNKNILVFAANSHLNIESSVGDPTIYVVYLRDNFLVGTRGHIEAKLRNSLAISAQSGNARSEFGLAFGNNSEKKFARNQVLTAMTDSGGSDLSRNSYAISAAANACWNIAANSVSDKINYRDLLFVHRTVMLDVNIEEDAILPKRSWAKIEKFLTISLAEFSKAVRQELQDNPQEGSSGDIELISESEAQTALFEIRSAKWQEERISLLLKYYVNDREMTQYIIDRLDDRSALMQILVRDMDFVAIRLGSRDDRIAFAFSIFRSLLQRCKGDEYDRLIEYSKISLGSFSKFRKFFKSRENGLFRGPRRHWSSGGTIPN